jgi:hypothetical protein
MPKSPSAPRQPGEHHTLHEHATLFWPLHLQRAAGSKGAADLSGPIANFLLKRRANPAFATWMHDARALSRAIVRTSDAETRHLWNLLESLELSFCEPPSPYFLACVFGISEVIDRGPPTPRVKQNEQGMEDLHLACQRGRQTVVERLLFHYEPVNTKDMQGRTPLYTPLVFQTS